MRAHSTRIDAWTRTALLTALASAALTAGTLVYLIDRAPGHALLIPRLAIASGTLLFGPMGAWLPSFVHPLAFALLTAAVLPAASPWRYGGCAAWGAVNAAFELGQHAALKATWLALTERGVVPVPVARYFIHGTFDVADLVAAVVGAFAAAACLRYLDRFKENEHAR
jgi:hypothetical protein